MPKTCIICKVYYNKRDNRSFHSFPKRGEACKKWHFSEHDFIITQNRRYLKLTAVPYAALSSSNSNNSVSDVPLPSSSKKRLTSKIVSTVEPSTSMTINAPPLKRVRTQTIDESTDSVSRSESGTLTASQSIDDSTDSVSRSDGATLTASEDDSRINIIENIHIKPPAFSKDGNRSVGMAPKRQLFTRSSSSRLTASISDSATLTASSLSPNIIAENIIMPDKQCKRREFRYPGDIHSDDVETPRRAKKAVRLMKDSLKSKSKKIRYLKKTNLRLAAKVNSLKALMKHLKEKNLITETAETIIEASLPGAPGELIKRLLKGPSREKYSEKLKSFALTLNFFSPKAYNYVREQFNKSLPHCHTITKWYQSVGGMPGFTQESLRAIQIKVHEARSKEKELVCNLVIDEMSIRKLVEWTGDKFVGSVDIGQDTDADLLPEATEVLVFMIVALNDHWKIPVGYFLLNGISGEEKAALIIRCLEFLNHSNIIISSLTFDGAKSNFNMANELGAKLDDVENIKSYFINPVTNRKIYIFLDPCHMLKLVRNTLASIDCLVDGDGSHIQWKFLENLVQLQEDEGVHAATRIRRRHIDFKNEVMKVRIAAQTISRSVSDALLYCSNDLKLRSFENAQATANFVRKFNDLFDIFNSRNRFQKYLYKRPFSSATENEFLGFFDEIKKYITNLKMGGKAIIESRRKTGFLGFLVCIESLIGLYLEYIRNENAMLKYLLSYKISQDHLEIFFSIMRSRGGHNNNPTARQFQATYKRLIVHTQIKSFESGNAIPLDGTSILQCSSSQSLTLNKEGQNLILSEEYLKEIETNSVEPSNCFTEFVTDVVSYVSGFVVKRLKKCITSNKCLNTLVCNSSQYSALQRRKTYGDLIEASEFVKQICKLGEAVFREKEASGKLFKPKYNVKIAMILEAIKLMPNKYCDYFGEHYFDDAPLEDHFYKILKLILDNFFDVRIHQVSKKKDTVQKRVRSILTKSILFQNQ